MAIKDDFLKSLGDEIIRVQNEKNQMERDKLLQQQENKGIEVKNFLEKIIKDKLPENEWNEVTQGIKDNTKVYQELYDKASTGQLTETEAYQLVGKLTNVTATNMGKTVSSPQKIQAQTQAIVNKALKVNKESQHFKETQNKARMQYEDLNPSKGINYREKQRDIIKHNSPLTHIANTRGFTSNAKIHSVYNGPEAPTAQMIPEENFKNTKAVYDAARSVNRSKIGVTDLKNQIVRNSSGKVVTSPGGNIQLDNYLVYDYETVGKQGTKTFAPTQVAFRGKVGGNKVEYNSFMQIDGDAKAYLEQLVDRMNSTDTKVSLTQSEKEQLMWLSDFRAGTNKNGQSVLTAVHEDRDASLPFSDTVKKQITEGFSYISGKSGSFINLKNANTVKTELLKAIGGTKGLANVLFAGNNISGFDNDLLVSLLGQTGLGKVKTLDIMSLAKNVFKRGQNIGSNQLYGFTATELARSFGVTEADISKIFLSEQGDKIGQELLSQLQGRAKVLTHSGAGDVIPEEKVLIGTLTSIFKNPKTASMLETGLLQSKTFTEGMVYKATTTRSRIHADEGAFDKNGNALTMDANAWNFRMSKKGNNISFGAIKSIGQGRFGLSYKDVDFGTEYLMTGNSVNEILDRVTNMVNLDKGKTMEEYQKSGEGQEMLLNKLFGNSNLFMRVIENINDLQKLGNVKDSLIGHEQKATVEALLNSQNKNLLKILQGDTFQQIYEGLNNIGTRGNGNERFLRDLALKEIGVNMGAISRSSYSAEDILKYATTKAGANDFNSVRTQLRNFLNFASMGLDKETHANLLKMVNNATYSMGNNTLYGLAATISEALSNSGLNVDTNRTPKAVERISKTTHQTQDNSQMIKDVTAAYNAQFVDNPVSTMYEAQKNNNIGKALDGTTKHTRLKKMGVTSNGKYGAGSSGSDANFASNTMGNKLAILNEVAGKQGLQTTIVGSDDGKSLEVRLFNPKDVGSDNYSSVTIPIADENGDIFYKGMKRVDTMQLKATPKMGTNHDFDFEITTASETMLDNIIKYLGYTTPLREGQKVLAQQISEGNYGSGNNFLRWITDKVFETSGSLAEQKHLRELSDDDLEGGNAREMHAKRNRIEFKGAIDKVVKSLSGQIGNYSDSEISNFLLDYIYGTTYNMQDFIASINGDLGAAFAKDGKFSYLANSLTNIGRSLPQAQLESLKEAGYFLKQQMNFGGARDLVVGADLNSMTKRAHTQIARVLNRVNANQSGTTQRIRSGHEAAKAINDYNTAEAMQFNIAGINDGIIKNFIDSEVIRLQKAGVTGDDAYLSELQKYQKTGMPSVHDDGVLLNQKYLANLESYQNANVTITDEMLADKNFQKLLANMGYSVTDLQSIGKGVQLPIINKTGGLTEGEFAWGKKNSKAKHIMGKHDSFNYFVREESTGNLLMNYNKSIPMKEGIKLLAATTGGRHTINQIVSDTFMQRFASHIGMSGTDLTMLTEQKDMSKTVVPNAIATYEYILNEALTKGTITSGEQLQGILNDMGALGRYFTVQGSGKDMYVESLANIQTDGNGTDSSNPFGGSARYVDAKGNAIFNSTEEATKFLSTDIADFAKKMGVSLPNQGATIMRSRLGVANEHQWTRAIGFDTYENTEAYSPLQIDDKARQTILRSINNMMGVSQNSEAVEAYRKAWQQFGDQSKDPNYQKNVATAEAIQKAFKNALTNTNTIDVDKMGLYVPKDVSHIPTSVGTGSEKGLYKVEDYKETPYAKLAQEAFNAGKDFISLTFEGMNLKLPTGMEGTRAYVDMNSVVLPVRPDFIKNGKFDLGTSQTMMTWEKRVGDLVRLKSLIDNGTLDAGRAYEQVQTTINNLYGDMFNSVWNKEGSINQAINKKRVGSSLVGTASGLNMLSEMEMDSQVGLGAHRGYSDVSIGVENFKDQLRISQDLWKYMGQGYKDSEPNKQRLNMARTNLGYLYQSLLEDATIATQGKEHKALAEQVVQFKKLGLNLKTGQYNVTQENMEAIINNITTLTDISGDFGQFKLGIGGSLLRWPLTNDMGTPVVNMRADSSLDAKTIKINSGMAKLLNADFDSDKIYLAMHMMESSYGDYAEFKKVLSGQRELMQQDQGRIKGLAQQMQVDYLSDNALFFVDEKGNRISKETYFKSSIEDRQKYRMLTNAEIQKLAENGDKEINKFFEGKQDKVGKTGNYLYNGITQDIVETLVAKRQFSHIGQFSNVNTGIRRAFDDIGLGAGTADGANQELVNKNRVTGFMINAFDEYLEQDSISAKKVAGLLDDIMKNDQLDAKGKRDAISRAVSSLSGAYKRYQASDYVASRDASQNVSYWQGVFSDLSNKFGVLSNDKGVQGRQFDLAIESLKSSGMTEDDIAKAMGFETASDIFSIDDFGVSRFALTPDKMVDALSRLYAHADSMSASTGSGKNLMSRRWNYIAEGKEATEENVGKLINQAVTQAYKRNDYDAKYNTHNFQSKLVNSSLDTTGNKHEYANTTINGIDIELSKIDDMHKVSVTQAGHWIQPYEEYIKDDTYKTELFNMRNLWTQLSNGEALTNEWVQKLNNAFVDPTIRERLFGDLKTNVFGSERGTAIHGIFEDIEKNFSGQNYETKEDFINAIKTGKGYQEALERYADINKRVQQLGFTEKNIFGDKDISDLADYADLYRQHRVEFAKSGDIGVFAEKPMGMYFENADGQGFLMNGTADAITERGITDYKVKGKIDGVLESWQLNTLWRMKKANMNVDLAHMGHSLVGGEALTADFVKKFLQSPDTDITKLSPLMREALGYVEGAKEPWNISNIDDKKLTSYINMLNNYTAGRDPLLTIKWFRELNGQKIISNLKFDEMDDATYSRLTNYVNSIVQNNPQNFEAWKGKAQIQDMIEAGFQLNTLNRKESVGYNEAGKEVNPFDPLDLLYGARVNDDVFDAYELAKDKKTKDKVLRNIKALETLGLKFTNEELDPKKNPELFNAYRKFVESRGVTDQHTLNLLRTHAINPDDAIWSENEKVLQTKFQEQFVKANYGNDVVEYYKESIASGKESYFAGIKNIAGDIERVKFEGDLKFTEDAIEGNLTDADKAKLLKLEEFRHTHLSGALSPSSSDIKQLKQIYDYQLKEGKEVALKRFIIDTNKQSLTIDVDKIAQIDQQLKEKGAKGFDWIGFAELFNQEELNPEELKNHKDFGKFFLGDSGVLEQVKRITLQKEQVEPFKVQNMVEALKQSRVNPQDLFSMDQVKVNNAIQKGGTYAQRLSRVASMSPELSVDLHMLTKSFSEVTKREKGLSRLEGLNKAQSNLVDFYGSDKMRFDSAPAKDNRAKAKSIIEDDILKDTGLAYEDLNKTWREGFERALDGTKVGKDFTEVVDTYLTELDGVLSAQKETTAKKIGLEGTTTQDIDTAKANLTKEKQKLEQSATDFGTKVEALETQQIAQDNYQQALKKATIANKEIQAAQQGKGSKENLKELQGQKETAIDEMLKEGVEAGIFQYSDAENRAKVESIINKATNAEIRQDEKTRSDYLKTGIHDIEALQKMLASGAPTQFTDSMAKAFENVATQVGENGDLQSGIQAIVGQMSDIQKIQMLQQVSDQFNATLAQDRAIANKQVALEQQTTRQTWRGETVDKTSVLNPWQNKMIQTQKTMLGIEASRVEAEQRNQMEMVSSDPNMKQQFEDRQKFNQQLKDLNKTYLETQKSAQRGAIGLQQFGHSFNGMIKTAFQYGVVYRGAQALIQQIYTIIGSIKEFDTLEAQIRMTKDVNKETAADMIGEYRKIADEYGTLTTAVAQSSITFLRQGRNVEDTNTLIKQSTTLAKVGFMEEAEAAELLTATLNGFNLEAKEAAEVVDLVAYTDTIAATSAQELMTAFQYVASSADVAGFEIEKLNAMIATSSETTRLSASTIGQAYKTMVSRLQQVKIGSLVDEETGEDISNMDKMLKQYGIDIMDINGKMKDGDVILEELSEKWKTWGNDTAKKREAVEALAGVRQGNIAMSLMDNWERYEEILSDTEANASGSSKSKMEAQMESINASVARLQNALHDISSTTWATGLYKWVVDLATGFVEWKEAIILVGGAMLLLKNNGAGLNAIYNIQAGLIERLTNSFHRLKDAQGFAQQQAQKQFLATNVGTISGGGLTAFIDPTTGAVSEPMDSKVAASTLAFNSESNLRQGLEKTGQTITEDFGMAMQGQEKLQAARINYAQFRANGITQYGITDDYAKNITGYLGTQRLAGNLNDNQRGLLMRAIGASAEGGFTNTQIDNILANRLGFSVEDGVMNLDETKLTEENVQAIEKGAKYRKEHIEALKTPQDNVNNSLQTFNKVLQQVTSSLGTLNDTLNTNATSEANETKENIESATSENNEQLANELVKDSEITEDVANKNSQMSEQGETNASSVSTQTELEEASANRYSTQSEFQQGTMKQVSKGQQALSVGTSMLGMMGGSMLGTEIASSLGASGSTASMVGMLGGMGTSMLGMFGPWGMAAQALIGVGGMIFKGVKENQEKIKEELRKTFQEASEHLKEIQTLEDEISKNDWQTRFKELSQGVDETGQNISLSDEDYEEYRGYIDSLLEQFPELATTYNAEGEALIERNEILQKSIDLIKEQTKAEREKMYNDEQTELSLGEAQSDENKAIEGAKKSSKGTNVFKDSQEYKQMVQEKNKKDNSTWDENGKDFADVVNKQFTLGVSADKLISMLRNNGVDAFANSVYANNPELVEELIHKQYKQYEQTVNPIYQETDKKVTQIYKNWASVQEGYDLLDTEGMEAIGQIITTRANKNWFNSDNFEDSQAKITGFISLFGDSGFKQLYNDYQQNKDTYNSDDNDTAIKDILDYMIKNNFVSSNQEAFQLAKDLNLIALNADESLERHEIANSKRQQLEKEVRQKMVQDEVFSDIELEAFSNQKLEEINNNWDTFVFKPINGGFSDLEKAYDRWKQHVDDSFKEAINISAIKTSTDGIDSLMSATKTYRETTYTDETGTHFVMSPEVYENLMAVQKAFNLTDEQMDMALLNNTTGEWELLGNNVEKLTDFILSNTFNGQEYSLEQIRIMDANFRSKGIVGAKELGYTDFLKQMVSKGKVEVNLDSSKPLAEQIQIASGVDLGDKKELYDEAIKTLDAGKLNYLNTISNFSEADTAIQTLQNLGKFGTNAGEAVKLTEEQLIELTTQIRETTEAFGGFSAFVNSLANSSLFTIGSASYDKLNSIMGSEGSADYDQLKALIEQTTGQSLGDVSAAELYVYANSAKEIAQANLQNRIDNYDKVNSEDRLKVGMADKEYRSALRSQRDLEQQLEDLNKEQKLDDLNLGVNKVKTTFDKLAKSIETVGSAIDLLDPKDFTSQFEFLNTELNLSSEYSEKLSEEWNRLLSEYANATTGEELEIIGEQLSSVSNEMTEQTKKQIELRKQLGQTLLDTVDTRIQETADVVNRELAILEMQRSGINSDKFNFYNVGAITSPLNFLPNMEDSDIDKAKSETEQLVVEERNRQDLLTKIKIEALDKIYAKTKTDREQDIQDTQEDLKDAIEQVSIAWQNKADANAKYSKDALIGQMGQFKTWLSEEDFIAMITTQITGNGDITQSGAQKVSDALYNNYNDGSGHSFAEMWKNPKEDFVASNSDWHKSGYYGDSFDQEQFNNDTERRYISNALYGTYAVPKDWTPGEEDSVKHIGKFREITKDGKLIFDYPTGESYSFTWDEFRQGQQVLRKGDQGDVKQVSSYADATPDTPISSGPITVAEHHPEFVKFKNGEGAIYDKTTILSGAEVDFVSDASYANGGKSNGTPVSAYAYGGNQSEAVETAKEVQENISESNENVVTNVEETNNKVLTNITDTNTEIEQNVTDNNKEISDTIETSWKDNEKTTNDSMWNIKDVTNTGLAEVVKTFAENMQELKDSVPQFVGNSNLVEIAQRFVGKQNTAGVFSGGRDEEWCADFISYIADLANISTSQLPRSASVATFYDFFEKNNQITNTPQVGDIVIVDKNQHIGIVTGVEEDGTVYTVSGNGGNKDNFKSTVHTATYTPEYIKKNNVSFGRMQGYDSGTIHTDVSNLGIVAEKRGEYIIDKKTGKPSYIEHDPQHPYDNIVDLSEYDVVSGEDSQAIRNKAYDKGTITSPNIKQTLTDIEKILEDIEDNTEVTAVSELGNDYDKVKDFIQQYTKPEMFVTEAFRRAQEQGEILRKKENENIFKQFKNSSGSILAVSQLQQYAENRRSQENWDVTIETNFKAITEYQNQLEKLNKLYLENKEYFDGHSEAYAALKEQFDNINQQIETFNSNLQQLTEQMVEEHARQTKIAMASIDTVYARMSKRLEEINNQINTLNDWESLTKLGEVLKLANATTNKKQTVDNQKTEYERIIKEQENIIQDILLGNMGLALKAQNSTEYKKIMDSILMADGQINVATNNAIMNLAEIYKTSKGDELSGSDAQLLEELMLALGIIKTTGPELAQKESEALQLEQEQFNIANQILEVSKQYLQQEYENRQSLFKAVIENTNSIKELTEMSGQLISDVNYREKAENFVEKYNASLKNVEAYRKRDDNLHLEREKQERYFYRHNGINLTKGFTAKGELIAGSTLAENYQEWKEALQDAIANRNEDEIDELTEKINGVDMYGQTLVDLNENQQSLQSALVSVVEQQKELIEQGQKYLEQYMEEMISQYKANTDTNSLINDKLSVIRDALSDFNRDEQLLIINGQLRNNANERVNLIEQQFAIKEEREALIRSSEAVVGISMDSLFTSKGEKNTSVYNEALQTVEDLYRSGSIREDEYITWQTNVEKVGEWKKQELELEEQIIDNYQNENKFLEEKISLIKESYDWQITKMSSLLELTNKRFDAENKIFELRHELDKELRSAKQSMQWLTKSERLKIFNEEDYAQLYQALDEMDVKTQSYYDDYYNQMMNLTEETLYQQEYITAEYERRMELVEAEYAITQKRVDLEKEQLKLKNVASEKSERMYVNGQWIQVANTEELISASDAVADAEKELELAQQEKLQKTQEIQMNEYIDSLKKIQAALENSTKATSKTEEELIGRLTQTIESLIGSGSTKGALNVVIDNLTTDLHNYEQITKTIINDELKEAVSTLSQVTTGLQTEITKQQEVLLDDRKQISDTIGYFNKKVNAVNTETLIDNLDELGDEILRVIGQLQGIDQNEGNRITYNQEAYDIMNDIAWNKKEWNNPNATEKYKTSLHEQNVEWFNQLSDMGFDKQVFLLKHLDGIEAEKFKNELKKYNASEWDIVTQRWLTNKGISGSGMSQYDIENLLGYINEIAWAKDEYTKAEANGNTNTMDWATNYADDIRHKVEKLELKGLEKQAQSLLKKLSYEETLLFKEELALQKDNAEGVIERWKTMEEGIAWTENSIIEKQGLYTTLFNDTTINFGDGVAQFTKDGERFTIVADSMSGTATIMKDNGVLETININNMGEIIDEIPSHFNEVADTLKEAVKSASTGKSSSSVSKISSSSYNSAAGDNFISDTKKQMEENSKSWHTADAEGKKKLEAANQRLGYLIGSTYNPNTGAWTHKSASGTKSAKQGLYNIDEIGKEIIIPSGRLRMMEYGDQVIPHNISENLLKWGTLNPALLRSLATPEHTNNITTTNSTEINIDTIKLDNVTNGSNFLPELNRYMKRTNSLL